MIIRKKISRYIFDDIQDDDIRIERWLKILGCEPGIRALPQVEKIAREKKLSHKAFLGLFLEQIMQVLEDGRIERWRKQAHFPWQKNLIDYDFSRPEYIDQERVKQLAECRWIENGGNVIFFGVSGVGKTHLSISLGIEAIIRGHEAKFITLDQLMGKLREAVKKDHALDAETNRKKFLSLFSNVKLLIIDDLAYTKIDQEVSDLLFQIIFRRYEQKTSTILTSNEGLDAWGKFFPDNQVRAMAVLDRILHDCTPINIRGQSFRSARTPIPLGH